MTPLAALKEKGLTVRLDGDVLRVGPPSLVTLEVRAFVRDNRPAIVAELNVWDDERAQRAFDAATKATWGYACPGGEWEDLFDRRRELAMAKVNLAALEAVCAAMVAKANRERRAA